MIGAGILKEWRLRHGTVGVISRRRLITVQYPEGAIRCRRITAIFLLAIRRRRSARGPALCSARLRGMSPQCIYIVKSDDKKPDYMGKPQFIRKCSISTSSLQAARFAWKLSVQTIKMDKDFELVSANGSIHCCCAKSSFQDRTSIITRFIRSKPTRLTRISLTQLQRLKRRKRLRQRQPPKPRLRRRPPQRQVLQETLPRFQ